jgi:hypothetical protein
MGERFLSLFLNLLSSADVPFQTIVVTTEFSDDAVWGGWQVIRLNKPRTSEGQLTEVVVGEVHKEKMIKDVMLR